MEKKSPRRYPPNRRLFHNESRRRGNDAASWMNFRGIIDQSFDNKGELLRDDGRTPSE